MNGKNILQKEKEAIKSQSNETDKTSYDVYVDNYTNYGDWYDCNDWH